MEPPPSPPAAGAREQQAEFGPSRRGRFVGSKFLEEELAVSAECEGFELAIVGLGWEAQGGGGWGASEGVGEECGDCEGERRSGDGWGGPGGDGVVVGGRETLAVRVVCGGRGGIAVPRAEAGDGDNAGMAAAGDFRVHHHGPGAVAAAGGGVGVSGIDSGRVDEDADFHGGVWGVHERCHLVDCDLVLLRARVCEDGPRQPRRDLLRQVAGEEHSRAFLRSGVE